MLKLIKNYFLERLLDTRLYFIKSETSVTDFVDRLKSVKKILIILPLNRREEKIASQFLSRFGKIFDSSQISTLDVSSLRKNDVNWLGVPNTKYLNNIRNEQFEMIIDLNGQHDRLCTYLGALTGASMRLHLSEGKFDKIYNLQIRTDAKAPISTRYHNLLNYLNLMRHGEQKNRNYKEKLEKI